MNDATNCFQLKTSRFLVPGFGLKPRKLETAFSEKARSAKNQERKLFMSGLTRTTKPGTWNQKRRTERALDGVFGPFVFGSAHPLFDGRIGDGEDRNGDQNDDAWEQEPLSPVGRS